MKHTLITILDQHILLNTCSDGLEGWLSRALAALPEDQGLTTNAHMIFHNGL